jgi:hypothetical protein
MTIVHHRPVPFLLAAGLALAAGCPTTDDTVCPPLDELGSGEVSASVDGNPWSATDGSWFWSGTSVQVITGSQDGWRLSMVGRMSADGQILRDAVDAGFPVEIPLTTGLDGGWVLLYPDSGDSFASENAGGGSWFITAIDGADLRGCFSAEVSDGDRTFTIDDAILDVPQSSL